MPDPGSRLARRIGPLDATLIVMGGIVGSGIFVAPAIVARAACTGPLTLAAWLVGGVAALLGAFVYAELSSARPDVGGQYAYLREAIHPLAGFLYGWALLLVIQTGGMAATAIAFARYARELAPVPLGEGALAALALGSLTAINCLGVRAGSSVQGLLMVLKIGALAALIGAGFVLGGAAPPAGAGAASPGGFAASLIPVLFAYGGWQTSCSVAGEMRDPGRDLPRALLAGVLAVIVLYTLVAAVCLRVLGAAGLAESAAPALEVMTRALGRRGGLVIAAGIALSTLGFLSQSILTAPRVYFAMAEDGLFFRSIARVHPRTRVPAAAIALQGALALGLALAGTYEAILRYVVAIDFVFFALTAACLFVLRRRGVRAPSPMPGHPVTTLLFIALCAAVVIATYVEDPAHACAGLGLTLAGVPAYWLWRRAAGARPRAEARSSP